MQGSDAADRGLDIVVFGASGFVGRLVAAYLAEHSPAGVRVGLAGRSVERLAAVREGLGPAASAWPLQQADVKDPAALAALAASTKVVATTVGPYVRHGLPLVEACARAGTDYADLTGEVVFVRRSIDGFHRLAAGTGARIVHACGFDSVPSDLGVLLLHEQAARDDAGSLGATVLVLVSARGGVSGGTLDSMRAQLDSMRADPAVRRLVGDPYALSPDRAREPDRDPGPNGASRPDRASGSARGESAEPRDPYAPASRTGRLRARIGFGPDPQVGGWTAPFVMAPFNTRIVRRSNAVAGYAYGRAFRYREVMAVGGGAVAPVLAAGATLGLGMLGGALAFRPTRAVVDRLLPKPGSGPDEETRRAGHFRVQVHSRTTRGVEYVATVAAHGDPGYAATAVMLGESALCLALDRAATPDRAGVLTPATALGGPLVNRLRRAGFELSVERR